MKGKLNLGKEIEEIVAIKNKAERNVKLAEEDFVNVSIRTSEQVYKELTKLLNKMDESEKQNKIEVAEEIYKVLMETDFRKLEKCKDNYDGWKDLNDRFNS